jgi:hypothetical protein
MLVLVLEEKKNLCVVVTPAAAAAADVAALDCWTIVFWRRDVKSGLVAILDAEVISIAKRICFF